MESNRKQPHSTICVCVRKPMLQYGAGHNGRFCCKSQLVQPLLCLLSHQIFLFYASEQSIVVVMFSILVSCWKIETLSNNKFNKVFLFLQISILLINLFYWMFQGLYCQLCKYLVRLTQMFLKAYQSWR